MSAVLDPAPAASASGWRGAGLARVLVSLGGVAALLGLWQLGGALIAASPSIAAFADLAPGPTLARLVEMIASGEAWRMTAPSLTRIGLGLAWAIAIGVPTGLALGAFPLLRAATNLPFQFLRMISPLSWMPMAILAFATWDAAIVFLVAVAAVWPIVFATAAGYRRIDPSWLRVARNLGARPAHLLVHVILPAIAQDVLTGIRLALGVAWVVLVPAEFLGVTSGLGYAINDARDTLEYDRLMAIVLIIGAIGFCLDTLCQRAIASRSWQREP
ncbi:ABC transporter permease [Salinarimonas sp.]|uniref:ABC transporter permease n=1 Tax=Salinarimonas sp. TaxID=2766526 RepID=UPI0039188E15